MRQPQKPRRQLYAKMTADDWKLVKSIKEVNNLKSQVKSKRESSVQFVNTSIQIDDVKNPGEKTQASSILRKSTSLSDINNELDEHHNALHPIQKALRDELKNLKMESLLMKLCNDSDT